MSPSWKNRFWNKALSLMDVLAKQQLALMAIFYDLHHHRQLCDKYILTGQQICLDMKIALQ